MKVKSESEVTQSCPTPSNPMDCSLLGSSVHGIFQARVLEWGAITFSDIFTSFPKSVYMCSVTSVMSDSLDNSPPGSSVHFSSKNIGVCCHALLQGIFPIQGSNLHLLHCRWILYYWATSTPKSCVHITKAGCSGVQLLWKSLFWNYWEQGVSFYFSEPLKWSHKDLVIGSEALRKKKGSCYVPRVPKFSCLGM